MGILRDTLMNQMYGIDIWLGFQPLESATLTGWNGNHPSLAKLATNSGEKLVVDVGVWKGQSTINMALAMKEAHVEGCILAIDTFLGSREHWDMSEFQRVHGLPNLFQIFMSNVYKAGVTEYVIPIPQTSITAAMVLRSKGISPNLVHIDAAHEYEEVLRDCEEYYGILAPGGYLIGDDYHYTWPGVVRAAGEFSARMMLPMSIEGIKWIVQKPSF